MYYAERLRVAFSCFDTDYDGVVSHEELMKILQFPGPHAFSSGEAKRATDAIIAKFDGAGVLQFGEFVEWWASNQRSRRNQSAATSSNEQMSELLPLFRDALDGCRAKLGDQHLETLIAIDTYARLLHDLGRMKDAELLFCEALVTRRATLGDQHVSTLTSINNYAVVLQAQGKLEDAEPLLREALDGRNARLYDRHPDTLASLDNSAGLLHDQGRLDEAALMFREALLGRRIVLGEHHVSTLISMNNLAVLLCDQNKSEEAL